MTTALSSPAELMAELAELDACISLQDDGRLVVDIAGGTPYLLQRACKRWRGLLRWGLNGAEGGYRWVVCEACGDLLLAQEAGGPCLTSGCPGRTRAIPSPKFVTGVVPVMDAQLAR